MSTPVGCRYRNSAKAPVRCVQIGWQQHAQLWHWSHQLPSSTMLGLPWYTRGPCVVESASPKSSWATGSTAAVNSSDSFVIGVARMAGAVDNNCDAGRDMRRGRAGASNAALRLGHWLLRGASSAQRSSAEATAAIRLIAPQATSSVRLLNITPSL